MEDSKKFFRSGEYTKRCFYFFLCMIIVSIIMSIFLITAYFVWMKNNFKLSNIIGILMFLNLMPIFVLIFLLGFGKYCYSKLIISSEGLQIIFFGKIIKNKKWEEINFFYAFRSILPRSLGFEHIFSTIKISNPDTFKSKRIQKSNDFITFESSKRIYFALIEYCPNEEIKEQIKNAYAPYKYDLKQIIK